MSGNPFIVGIVLVAMLNGLFSPFFVVTSQVMITATVPPLLLAGPSFVAFFGSLVAATATIILSGVPAAVFERLTGRQETDTASFAVWLTAAIAISLPALLNGLALLA